MIYSSQVSAGALWYCLNSETKSYQTINYQTINYQTVSQQTVSHQVNR